MTTPDPIADARAYIEALASHDVSAVRLADGCRRVENGIRTGSSGPAIIHDLDVGRKYRVIRRVEIIGIEQVEGGSVQAEFLVHVVFGLSARVRERFDVDLDGRIDRITARIGFPPRRR
ncbi:hypothetical protein [Williamsia deligens]|uniref:DUF8021 domain-containing protein n=1 Tax=Williamsia deligens TaxID=321325 RepID=A0ABW3G3W3_9NOCA|nr:hypothetical protein [Williamsia deligens]MCP2194346.1 hypothetical protein [Williamsia deligens]